MSWLAPRPGPFASLTLFVAICFAGAFPASAHVAGGGSARATYDLSPGWRLFAGDPAGAQAADFDDAAWKVVALPHGWNEDDAFRQSIRDLRTGVAWYRKRFALPPEHAGKKVFLEFQGVRHAAEVYVNGEYVGRHENGVMAFGLDVTGRVKPGPAENVVAVRVDSDWGYREKNTNTPYQWSDRNFYANYGGINKPAFLHVADPLHQTLPLYAHFAEMGVYVYATDHDVAGRAATVVAESEVRNDHREPRTFGYEVVVTDAADGRVLKRFASEQPTTIGGGATATVSARARVDGLQWWSWGYGYLYDVTTALTVDGAPVDAVRTRTGFRKTGFKDGVLRLNDRVVHLKGYAQRTTNEWPALGINIPPWVSDFSNGMMVESNANLVRWMHVTPSKQDVESCDRVGLMQAVPAGDSERDPSGRRWDMRVELMRDAIVYNRNNPSVIFWEAGNAGISDDHMGEMVALRDRFDPHGGRAMGSRNMLGSKTAEWGGDMLYVNKSRGKVLWATEYSRDEGLRKYWDEFSPPFHKEGDGPLHNNQPAHSYNHNQDHHAIENVRRWFDYHEHRPGTGDRVNGGAVNIIFSDTNTHYRGAEDYRRSGEVDAMRLPKDGYFAHKVMWDGWVDVERPAAHVIGHWNYAPGTVKDVHVVSGGAHRVELLLNGKSVGAPEQRWAFLFTFKDVAWQPGTLEAVGYDAAGNRVCSDVRKTAGEPSSVRLTLRTGPGGLRADGLDIALVDVEVVDADGNRCPTALHPIYFKLSGPAEWRGGIAQAPGNGILATTLPVECGVNRVSVRSTTTPGTIEITASADGLRPASVTLSSSFVEVVDGLSRHVPGDGLPSNVSRGPTPPPVPLPPSRLVVRPARIVTGANDSDAAKLADDDESTAWANDGKLSTAWVRVEFDRPTTVSQVVVKPASWRTRSYPIRITGDDGKVLFTGAAGRSLGYSTLAFPPASCRSLRIEMTGERRDGDGSDLIEVTGKIDPTGAADPGAPGKLSIHELEVFGPADTTPPPSR